VVAVADLAALATEEYTRRRETARKKVAAKAIPAHAANQLVLPWLAIACRAGADLPELAGALAELTAVREHGKPFLSDGDARAIVADSLCPLPALREVLGRALGAAARRAETAPGPDSAARFRTLQSLARLIGAPILISAPALERAA
jgi:hypothetical protein